MKTKGFNKAKGVENRSAILKKGFVRNKKYSQSLGYLATRLVDMMRSAPDGTVDLRVAALTLAVGHKRRLYDITCALEGIGLITKKHKNHVRWNYQPLNGELDPKVDAEYKQTKSKIAMLRKSIEDMKIEEKEIDEQVKELKKMTAKLLENSYAYVTDEDLYKAYGDSDKILLGIRRDPLGANLSVTPREVTDGPPKFELKLKSNNSKPFNVVYFNRTEKDETPKKTTKPVIKEEKPSRKQSFVPTNGSLMKGLSDTLVNYSKVASVVLRNFFKDPSKDSKSSVGKYYTAVTLEPPVNDNYGLFSLTSDQKLDSVFSTN